MSYHFIKRCTMKPACQCRVLQLVLQCRSEWGAARIVHLWRFFWGKEAGWWLIDWLYNGFLIISGIRRGFLMTNKQHSINYTISKGIYGRNNQRRAKGERMLFFTETERHEPRVTRALYAFTFLLLYFVPTFIITGVLRSTVDSISQSLSILLLKATRVK